MKRIFTLLMCMAMLFSLLAGCTGAEQKPTETTEPAGFDPAKLTINGVALEEYTIVYAQDGQYSKLRSNKKWIESGKLEHAAKELRNALKKLTGKELSIVSDKEKETEYEIILGKANRKAAKNYYQTSSWTKEKYAYGVFENKLILAGGSANACYFAGVDFIEACKALQTCDFSAEMVKGEAELIEVACVGDSITDGAGQLDNGAENERNTHSWPIFLQKMLGFKYYVGNYGYSGRMMIDYAMTDNFAQSVEAKPDVVIMMLGTNDCNSDKNPDWGTKGFQKTYCDAADSMISKYRAANPDVQVFMMTPPSVFSSENRKEQCSIVADYIREFAQEQNLDLVDMWAASEKADWTFNDGIHPQGDLYAELAQVVYDGVKDTIKK